MSSPIRLANGDEIEWARTVKLPHVMLSNKDMESLIDAYIEEIVKTYEKFHDDGNL